MNLSLAKHRVSGKESKRHISRMDQAIKQWKVKQSGREQANFRLLEIGYGLLTMEISSAKVDRQ